MLVRSMPLQRSHTPPDWCCVSDACRAFVRICSCVVLCVYTSYTACPMPLVVGITAAPVIRAVARASQQHWLVYMCTVCVFMCQYSNSLTLLFCVQPVSFCRMLSVFLAFDCLGYFCGICQRM